MFRRRSCHWSDVTSTSTPTSTPPCGDPMVSSIKIHRRGGRPFTLTAPTDSSRKGRHDNPRLHQLAGHDQKLLAGKHKPAAVPPALTRSHRPPRAGDRGTPGHREQRPSDRPLAQSQTSHRLYLVRLVALRDGLPVAATAPIPGFGMSSAVVPVRFDGARSEVFCTGSLDAAAGTTTVPAAGRRRDGPLRGLGARRSVRFRPHDTGRERAWTLPMGWAQGFRLGSSGDLSSGARAVN